MIELSIRRPWLVLALVGAVTAIALVGVLRLSMETDLAAMLPADHPAIAFERELTETFHARDPVLVAVVGAQPGALFDAGSLAGLHRLDAALAGVDGIEVGSILSLYSVGRSGMLTGGGGALRDAPTDERGARRAREEVEASPDRYGELVSRDGSSALVVATLERGLDDEVAVFDRIRQVARDVVDPDDQVVLAGFPVVTAEIDASMRRDITFLVPLVLFAMLAILGAAFRSRRGVAVPTAVVVVATLWSLGLMSWVGVPLYPMSSMLPTVLVAIGTAQAIHVMTHFLEHTGEGVEPREAVRRTLGELKQPLLLTSLTTAIGFGSLVSSPMRPVQAFGGFTAFGVLVSMLLSFSFVPALLALMPPPARPHAGQAPKVREWLERFGRSTVGHRRPILAAVAIVVALVAPGLADLEVEANVLANLDPDGDVPRAHRLLDSQFSGATILNVIVEGAEPGIMKEPAALARVEALQRSVESLQPVGATRSIVDLLATVRSSLTSGEDGARLPETRDGVSKLVTAFAFAGKRDLLAELVTADFRSANVEVRLRDASTRGLRLAIEGARTAARDHLDGSGLAAHLGGTAHVMYTLLGLIVDGQIVSLAVALIGAFVVCAVVFRALVGGLLCVFPIAVATGVTFGVMGLAGTPLDLGTTLVAGIGIGVGIDYAIHFMDRYVICYAACGDHATAAARTMRTTGVAIGLNAAVVVAGFGLLALSSFPPISNVGRLVSLSMTMGFLGTVTALPAALALADPGFLRRR